MKTYSLVLMTFFILISCKTTRNCEIIHKDYSYIQYYEMIYEADVLFSQKRTLESKVIYEKAFSMFEPLNLLTFYEIEKLAQIYAQLNDLINCENMILKLFAKGYKIDFFEQKDRFKNIVKSKRWKFLKVKYINIRKDYLSKIDLPLRSKIESMVDEDQRVRRVNLQIKENFRAMKIVDSTNQTFLFNLLEAGKFPNEELIGNFSIDNKSIRADVLFLHTPDSMRINYYVPKLFDLVKKGKCDPTLLAELIDQYYIYNNKKNLYSSYYSPDFAFMKPQNPEFIDLLRTSIGLPSIKIKLKLDSAVNLGSHLWKD